MSSTSSSDAERLKYLEALGHLPFGATTKDMTLASKTTWWGKPLDPKAFWAGKVVWCDKTAKDEAAAHGRAWPPIPYEDPGLPSYPDDDGFHAVGMGAEGVGANSAYSSKEVAFWCKFIATHPKPPEMLESQQVQLSERALKVRRIQATTGSALGTARSATQDLITIEKKRLINDLGFPEEALSDEALFWAYVMRARQDYERLQSRDTNNNVLMRAFLDSALVNASYLTGPLSGLEIENANRWKTAYLQRLRRQGTNETYITAYLKAWKLNPEDVF